MKSLPIFLVFLLIGLLCLGQNKNTKREYYQLTVYHYSSASQESTIDKYLEKSFLPALHSSGIKQVGVFKPIGNDTASDKQVFVLIPFKNLEKIREITDISNQFKSLAASGEDYLKAKYNNPPYNRMEVTLSYAFELAPTMNVPSLSSPRADRVYEFRSYESPTEALYRNKVKMFNAGGEIALFKRLNFNAVFYAEVLAGTHMPNLIYMTSFENMEQRNKHWKDFVDSPEWKLLVADEQYKNNVSRNQTILMKCTEYSDY